MATLEVDRIEAVADRGTFKIEDLEACEKAGVTAYVPKPIRGPAAREGFFSKEDFGTVGNLVRGPSSLSWPGTVRRR